MTYNLYDKQTNIHIHLVNLHLIDYFIDLKQFLFQGHHKQAESCLQNYYDESKHLHIFVTISHANLSFVLTELLPEISLYKNLSPSHSLVRIVNFVLKAK